MVMFEQSDLSEESGSKFVIELLFEGKKVEIVYGKIKRFKT